MVKDGKLHKGHWARLRTRALSADTARFTDTEMVELCLQYIFTRGDLNDIACRLISRFKSLDRVLNASVQELAEIEGIGQTAAEKLTLLPKIAAFYQTSLAKNKKFRLTCTEQCAELARQFLDGLRSERLYMFCVNKNGEVIKDILLGSGEDFCVNVSVHELVVMATSTKAPSVLFAHNHPNGRATPSAADIDFTRRACQILHLSGVRVLDHIIIGSENSYFSFAITGYLEKFLSDIRHL